MPGSIGSSAPGTRTNPAEKTSPSSNESSGEARGPTIPKPGMAEPKTDDDEEGPPPSVIRRAQLPPPSEIDDEEVYMVTFRSGNTVPMLGRELKDTLTTDRPPGMGQTADGQTNDTQNGSSGGDDGRKWWQDVLLGIGRIGGIFLRDRIGDGQELSPEEREALEEIARRRRQERLRQQRRNRWLLIGGVVVLGGLGLWLATRSSSAPAPPPPPPPPEDEEPEPQEPEEVEITDAEQERENEAAPSEGTPGENGSGEPEDLNPDNS